ncbi:MAG: phosphatidate cytidylyltransferase, partial [Proteobacteria bacterium]|nr:phosphatidate cytidylyltransferase [Pseudomonadota bacterium]
LGLRASIERLVTVLLGFLLVGVGGGAFVSIVLQSHGGAIVGWLVAVVSGGDTAAYFTGRSIGGAKLAPEISPGKTVSGAVGGLVASALIGGSLHWLISGSLGFLGAAALALVVGLFAQCGDLMKSVLKRLWGVKDSGAILPGHGGVLDRVDGLLGAATVLWSVILARGL